MASASETSPQMGNESANLKPESQGVTLTPAEHILGSCKGVLHDKVKFWMTEFPEHLGDFNLETYEDMQNNTEIDVAGTAAIIFEDINVMLLSKGKRGLGDNQKNASRKCRPRPWQV